MSSENSPEKLLEMLRYHENHYRIASVELVHNKKSKETYLRINEQYKAWADFVEAAIKQQGVGK